jgi:hypothetical protein
MNKDLYAPSSLTEVLLGSGRRWRRYRLRAADMITIREAAALTGTDASMIASWIQNGSCIGVAIAPGRVVLPRWQFEPLFWFLIRDISDALGTKDGWQLLSFVEADAAALDGLTPRRALEQGMSHMRVLAAAVADSH